MHNIYSLAVIAIILPLQTFAGVADPIADFKAWYALEDSRFIYKWTGDINGNGKKSVFFCTEKDYIEGQRENNGLVLWSTYVQDGDTGFRFIRNVMREDGVQRGGVLLDLDLLYIGDITQLGKRGLVTSWASNDKELSRQRGKRVVVVCVMAYILVGDHFEEKLLERSDLEQESDIYKQYFSASKRLIIQKECIPVKQ